MDPRRTPGPDNISYLRRMTRGSDATLPVIDLRRPAEHADHAHWRRLCRRSAGLEGEAERSARAIVEAVAERGDAAVLEFTARFEGRELTADQFEIPRERWEEARAGLDREVLASLELAAKRVEDFHRTQIPSSTGLDLPEGRLESRVRPLRRVAMYAPGGTAAYPSSVLMTAVPARVAGVDELILLTPRPSDVVLAAASIAGVHRVFQIGGAQAVAAAAFGTDTLPRVDKIVGPGNAYVTAAKKIVYGHCDVDSIAGPSEILVVADASADPAVVAADLISQAEHDLLASAILVTDAPDLVPAVEAALREQLSDLPRADVAAPSLRDHGAAVIVGSRAAMIEAADAFAPEHLELLIEDPMAAADELRCAGAIFVGPWTPEAAGDYTAGPSHVLPTAGGARFSSPLGVWDFVRYTSVLELTRGDLEGQAKAITTLARAEGLEGHARAVERRLGTPQGGAK